MTDHAGRDVGRASGSIDAYLRQLERELRQGGYADARVMEEVREHLVDAVDDGLGRGLSAEDAEREAFERFGPPEAIAAHLIPGRHPMINRFVTLTRDVVWPHRWWVLTPTVVTAILTSVLSYYYLPTRYRSESIIEIVSPQPVPAPLQSPAADQARARFQTISQTILNRSRLEWIIKDFGLYGSEQAQVPISNAVLQMRRDIAVEFLAGDARTENTVGGFKVSFESSNPTLALKITERLASLFVEENLRQREGQATGATQFLDAEIADLRRRLIELETSVEELRARNGRGQVSQADLIPYEVLRDRYKTLLIRREEYRSVANQERRELGEQFKVAEAARLPERPLGPSRLGVTVTGALMGLGVGLVVVGVKRRTLAA